MNNFTKNQKIFTIPNVLSMIRILLIPLIFYLYLVKEDYVLCACVLAVSYLSDLADGIIARHFNMISDLGKLLDPAADKLTQASMLICISLTHPLAWLLFALLAVKELTMALSGFFAVRRTGVVSGAKWYGKACTVVLNLMFAVMLFVNPTEGIFGVLFGICVAAMVASTVLYVLFFTLHYEEKTKDKAETETE